MRLLVSHQPPASHFCQPHAHSLFYSLHVIAKMVLLCVTVADINSRKALLDNYSYTCGSPLQDIELPEPFKEVYVVRNISCYEPTEKLYYSAGYDPICIYYAEEVTVQDAIAEFFPQCTQCSKPKIKK